MMGRAFEITVGVANRFPGGRASARFLARMTFYKRRFCIVKWETSLPDQAKEELTKSGLMARFASVDDLGRLVYAETWRSCDLYRKWLTAGRAMLLLEKNNEIMSYVWLDFGSEFEVEQVPELKFEMTSDTYFSDEAYTPFAYRGRGFRRLSFIAEILAARERGYRFMISYFLNKKAMRDGMKNFMTAGSSSGQLIKEVHLLEIVGFRYCWVKDLLEDKSIVTVRSPGRNRRFRLWQS